MKWVMILIGVLAFCMSAFCLANAAYMFPENIIQQIYRIAYALTGWTCMAVFVLCVIAEHLLGTKGSVTIAHQQAARNMPGSHAVNKTA